MNSALRNGMTLVELLVVVSIIVLLAAAAIPRLLPAMDRSRVREAARSVQLYLSAARNQAIATGRSCGVMIAAENGCSTSLTQVETPPPYGGDSTSSTATATLSGPVGGIANFNISGVSPPPGKGDLIQIGYQGYWLISNGTSGTSACLDTSHGETPASTITGPYKVLRWPTKSVASALELPSPAVIDLTFSGTDPAGSSPTGFTGTSPVCIMFAPNGSVDWIAEDLNGRQITTPVYLLIGKRENVNDTSTPPQSNLQDYSSLWVAINSVTGLIVTTDLAAVGDKTKPDVIYNSRAYARKSDAKGGK